MSSPLSTTGASSESNAWHELEDVFAGLGQLARSGIAPQEFYRTVLEECVRALSAVGGAVWLRAADGAFQPAAQIHWLGALGRDDASQRAHEAILNSAAKRDTILRLPPHAADATEGAANPTEHVLLLASVNGRVALDSGTTLAIIELLLRPDASPATYRGCEQFLAATCELAADYHAFDELQNRRENDEYRSQLLRFGSLVHRQLHLSETAYAVANEGRRIVGCDRLSIVTARGRRMRLLAASGVSRVERRSIAVRRIEQVAELVRSTDEPAFYTDGQCDALAPVAEALEQHAEESHARQVAVIALHRASRSDDDLATDDTNSGFAKDTPLFVLVAEQFDARHGDLRRDRLVEVGEVCATALYNALDYDRLPLVWLLRPAGELKDRLTARLSRTMLAVAALSAAIAALIFVPAEFNVEAPGALQPVVRREVFAPRSGLVDEVFVAHGASVNAGQPLVRLRDPVLELELKRVDGEMETAQRQIDAVRSTRTNRSVREANPADAYRLSAEERELEQRLANLQDERELLNRERKELVVNSPIAGQVLSWDVGHRLIARPVERGEVLVTVADLGAEWQLELAVPDDRIGFIIAAQQELQQDLPVRFRLSSDDREEHAGRIAEISSTADVISKEGTAPSPTVAVKVALEDLQLSTVSRRDLRPGVSARAQIACGQRSIGYVWLHDIWDAAMEWFTF